MNRWMCVAAAAAVAAAAVFILTSRADKAETGGVPSGSVEEQRSESPKTASNKGGQNGVGSERWDVKRLHVDSEYLLDEIAHIVRAEFDAAAQALPEGVEPDDEIRKKAVASALDLLETDPEYAVLKEAFDKRKIYLRSFDLKPMYLSHRAGVGPRPWMEKTLPNGVAIKIHPNTIAHVRYETEGWASEEDRLDIEKRERKAAALEAQIANASGSKADALKAELKEARGIISVLKAAATGSNRTTPTYINGDPKDPNVGVVEIDFGLIVPLEKEK